MELLLVEPRVALVWKPTGMRACGVHPGTLQSALRSLLPPSAPPAAPGASAEGRGGEGERQLACPAPISRLEIGCSGVVMVARTTAAAAELAAAVEAQRLSHVFVALVHGRPPPDWMGPTGLVLQLPAPSQRGPRAAEAAEEAEEAEEAEAAEEHEAEEEAADDEEADATGCEEAPCPAKRARSGRGSGRSGAGSVPDLPGSVRGQAGPIQLRVLSSTPADCSIALTTVRLECAARAGRLAGELMGVMRSAGFPVPSLYLPCTFPVPSLYRSAGFPVVGDRYARRERGALPRHASALKTKVHLRCLGVHLAAAESPATAAPTAPAGETTSETTTRPGERVQLVYDYEREVPPKLMAATWATAGSASGLSGSVSGSTGGAIDAVRADPPAPPPSTSVTTTS